jgi:hypothetical protein
MRLIRKTSVLLALALLLAPAAFAQEFTGTINGRVSDASGAVIPGVSVTLSSPGIQGTRQAVTGETGAYQFLLLPAGTYSLKFDLPGFKTIEHTGIIVQVQRTTTINTTLEVAATAETVTVTGESPVVDVQNATVAVNFNQAMLRDIPNSRDIWIILAQTPGVNTTRYDVGGSTMGSQSGFRSYGTSGQNTFNLDGINTTDGSGSAGWYFDYGSFSEIQVSAAANSAEVQTPGAFMNTVIKSGGNEVHGQVYFDWENKHFQASNVTTDMQRACPSTAAEAASFTGPCGLVPDPLTGFSGDRFERYNDFNGNIGGPIKKDKLWWFFSYRDQFSDLVTQLRTEDTPEFPMGKPGGHYTTRLRIPTLKFNWQVTQNNSFVFVWQHSRKKAPYRRGNGANAYQYIIESTGNQKDPSDGRKVEWTSILSPRMTLDLKVTDSEYVFPMYSHVEKTPTNDTATLLKRGGLQSPFVEWRKHWDWGGNLAYFKEGLGGDHNFKFGYDVYWESTRDYNLTYPGGGYMLVYNNGKPSQVLVRDYPYQSKNAVYQNAAYFQDKWQITRKLTLNLGVRWDRFAPYYPDQSNNHDGPFGDPSTWTPPGTVLPVTSVSKTHIAYFNNVVPRFNFAYDVFGDGKTAIKASAGRYTWNPSFSLASSANPNRGATYTYTWDGTLPITKAYLLSRPKPNSNVPASTTVASDLTNSYTDEYTVGIDQELINDLGLRVNYVRKIEQNPYGSVNTSRTIDAFTPVTITDIGRDGISGTADDQDIVVYNLLPEYVGVNNTLIKNFPGYGSNYSTIEANLTKRFSNKWMGLVGFDRTKRNLRQDLTYDPNTLNWGANADVHYWDWSFKSVFQYTFPHGINVTTAYNSQKGENAVRTFSVRGMNQGTFTATVEHNGENFYPSIHLWNARAEKQFKVNERQSIDAMFDLFNIPNRNTATGWVTNTGLTFQRQITALLNPRIFRLGIRYNF